MTQEALVERDAYQRDAYQRDAYQRDAYQALVERSLDAYMDLAYAPFS